MYSFLVGLSAFVAAGCAKEGVLLREADASVMESDDAPSGRRLRDSLVAKERSPSLSTPVSASLATFSAESKPDSGAITGELVTAAVQTKGDPRDPRAVLLHIDLQIAPEWYVHAADPRFLSQHPLTVSVIEDSGFALDGELQFPEPVIENGQAIYRDRVRIQGRLVSTRQTEAGLRRLQLVVNYQACSETQCKPPQSAMVAAEVSLGE